MPASRRLRLIEAQEGISERSTPSVEYDTESLRLAAGLARKLLQVEDPLSACSEAARYLARRFSLPITAWYGKDQAVLDLISVNRVEGHVGREIRDRLSGLPRWDGLSQTGRRRARRTYASIVGTPDTRVINAGDAVLLVGDEGDQRGPQMQLLGSFLRDSLQSLGAVVTARRRNDQLDVGLAVTAHELRSPIVSARMVLDRLLQAGGNIEASMDLAAGAHRMLEELSVQIDQLLRWSAGDREPRLAEGDLVEVVRSAIAGCGDEADGRVVVRSPERLPMRMDDFHMRVAVVNVIRNALAHTKGRILVVVKDEGFARVSVVDEGPGIPRIEQENIFDPFVRGIGSDRNSSGGLGLFIAKQIVEAHGGRILVESYAEGSTFHIDVPLER